MRFHISETIADGISIIELADTETGAVAGIYAFGGLLNSFRIPLKEGSHDLVSGFASAEDAQKNITNGFRSAKLSPFVCRMNKGRYAFGGITYQTHKHFLQAHAIHGLIYDAVYTIIDRQADDEKASVTLSYAYEGSDAGYPFHYRIDITWQLSPGNLLEATTAITNHSAGPIPVADGWHPYFTLGGSVDDWTLQFSNSSQLEYDEDLIPTGRQTTDNRFLHGALLKDLQLDNGFIFQDSAAKNQCRLYNKNIQLTIEPDNPYPVLQVYIPPHRESIALENLSGAPDNFNNGIGLIVLPPGETKTFTTRYCATAL